jgi:hypothetical protein
VIATFKSLDIRYTHIGPIYGRGGLLTGDLKEEGELMATEGPKTVRGWKRKLMTGDGRIWWI